MDITTKITVYTILAIVASVSTLVYVDYAYADEINQEYFDVNGYTMLTNSANIVEIQVNWDLKKEEPSLVITFDKLMNEEILLQIPKSMPRMTNLDFGHFSLHAIQSDDSWHEIKETESECYYILEIPVINSHFIPIEASSVAAGTWELVSINNPNCENESANEDNETRGGPFSFPPLKEQLAENVSLLELQCPNEKHILAERNNEKLACVFPYTLAKLELNPVDDSFWSTVVRFEEPFGIITHLSKTQHTESVKYNEDMNAVMIHVLGDEPEKLSVMVNRAILESGNDSCPPMPSWDEYFVLINGYEVAYENRLTTDDYRFLEIQVDLPSMSGENGSRGATQIHTQYDIPYQPDSKIIEIMGTCAI